MKKQIISNDSKPVWNCHTRDSGAIGLGGLYRHNNFAWIFLIGSGFFNNFVGIYKINFWIDIFKNVVQKFVAKVYRKR